MLRILARRPTLAVETSALSAMGCPLKNHVRVRGRSPWETEHFNEGDSPALRGSSPNEKGSILGATAEKVLIKHLFWVGEMGIKRTFVSLQDKPFNVKLSTSLFV